MKKIISTILMVFLLSSCGSSTPILTEIRIDQISKSYGYSTVKETGWEQIESGKYIVKINEYDYDLENEIVPMTYRIYIAKEKLDVKDIPMTSPKMLYVGTLQNIVVDEIIVTLTDGDFIYFIGTSAFVQTGYITIQKI